jgi:hypothetical protein
MAVYQVGWSYRIRPYGHDINFFTLTGLRFMWDYNIFFLYMTFHKKVHQNIYAKKILLSSKNFFKQFLVMTFDNLQHVI